MSNTDSIFHTDTWRKEVEDLAIEKMYRNRFRRGRMFLDDMGDYTFTGKPGCDWYSKFNSIQYFKVLTEITYD